MSAKIPRSEYPRPQFVRENWINLNGTWTYEFDFGKSGRDREIWKGNTGFKNKITVPFCPESDISGVGHKDFIESMFYHRKLAIPADWKGKRILLHFGAVDYACEAFIDGKETGLVHYGGTSSFTFDITEFVKAGGKHDLVLAIEDDQRSAVQPHGKQCYAYQSMGCFYTRTTGIWQTVWMEPVAMDGLKNCKIVPDLDAKAFHFTPEFFMESQNRTLRVTIKANGKKVAEKSVPANSSMPFTVELGKTVRAWCPEDPFLYDIAYELIDANGVVVDRVSAYAGLRKIHTENGKVYLNNKPIFLRLVLDQGFYPDGIWTAPSDEALKKDIELSMAAGFNGARLHQKVFEERFHYWADKLGYLTWGESSSWGLYCFSRNASMRGGDKTFWQGAWNFMAEWREIVERDLNHPSIIAWTPANETWSFCDIRAYRRLMTAIYDLTKSIDPTRPCNETSGYHHVKTDLWTVHLYRPDAASLAKDMYPEDKPVFMMEYETGYNGQPYINDEFGGFMYIPPERQKFAANTWGYHGLDLKNEDELCAKIAEQVAIMINDDRCAGYCYTQLTDVEQEQNGVYNYDRTLKVSEGKLALAFKEGKVKKPAAKKAPAKKAVAKKAAPKAKAKKK